MLRGKYAQLTVFHDYNTATIPPLDLLSIQRLQSRI